ncbi:MAG: hypothetical protein GYA24_14050 [Candidatus Lokiarchaeota archaeon]|nr:hypothetical protein [Candidatus Lokiarchaeota archaeon]
MRLKTTHRSQAALAAVACAAMILLSPSSNTYVKANAPCTIVMDGTISATEWACADNKTTFYLDIDNTPDGNGQVNVDGDNFLYLAEDLANLYICLDLCSDRSTDETWEWVGVWLMTAARTFDTDATWAMYLDNGLESLMYSVADQQTIPFLHATPEYGPRVYPELESEYQVVTGTGDGNVTLFDNSGSQPTFNVTSEFIDGMNQFRIDFAINLERCIPLFTEEFFPTIKHVRVELASKANRSVGNNNIVVGYANGTFNAMDPDQVFPVNGETTLETDVILIEPGNITAAREILVSLQGNSPSAFIEQVEYISFEVYVNGTNRARTNGYVQYPYSTIKVYQVMKSFGASPDCSIAHRMFEMRIPKSQLEHYDSRSGVGIIVAGYGTMTFVGSHYWVYSKVNNYIPYQDSTKYISIPMFGVDIPVPEEIPGYEVLVLVLVSTGIVTGVAFKRARDGSR